MNRKLALIIGNSEYEDQSLARLITPAADVGDLASALRLPDIGSFDEVTTLVNESTATLRRSIARLFAQKNPDDLLLLYFSGHGVLDDQGQLYLAVKDTERELLSGTAIPASFITGEMDRSRSRRQVLILDCCHSGAFARGTKGAVGASVGTASAFEGIGYGRVVLTATDATQYAWEGDRVIGQAENSVFTHHLIEGIQTGAADIDADGRITLDELYDYVYGRVVSQTPKQTPGKWSYRQQGDIVIAKNPRPIVKPAELPNEIRQAVESPLASVREGIVRELERLLGGSNAGIAQAAYEALKYLADDDSRRVSLAANASLAAYTEARHLREQAEADRLAAQRAEQERWAAQQAEAQRLDQQRAEAEREAKAERGRIAREKLEADRLAEQEAKEKRLAQQRAEAERAAQAEQLAAQKAEEERLARQRAEAERAALAEQERIAHEKLDAAQQAQDIIDTARLAAVASSPAQLIVRAGPLAGKTLSLKVGSNVLGRVEGLEITLPDVLVSRRHTRITVQRDQVTLEDLDSANGTFVNNRKITEPHTLKDGDLLKIGDSVFTFQLKTAGPANIQATPQAQASAAPEIAKQAQLETQVEARPLFEMLRHAEPIKAAPTPLAARARSVWPSILLSAIGWGIAFAVFPGNARSPSDYAITFAAAGIAGGLSTAIALRRSENSIRWWQIIIIAASWCLASAFFGGTIFSSAGSVLSYGTNAIGGFITALALRMTLPSIRWTHMLMITAGWAIGWLVAFGIASIFTSFLVFGFVGGAIGTGITLWQIKRAKHS